MPAARGLLLLYQTAQKNVSDWYILKNKENTSVFADSFTTILKSLMIGARKTVKTIRILHVIGGMGEGGAEVMIMNLYRHIDRTQIQFDFVVHTEKHQLYDDEIESLGGRIYHTRKYNIKNYFSYVRWWNKFLDEHPEYKIVHGHIGSSAAVYLGVSKKHGAVTIAHSHSSNSTQVSWHNLLWGVCSYPTRFVADYFLGCSFEAAIKRFGKRIAHSEKCRVMKNGIDCEQFVYDPIKRDKLRIELGIEQKYVIGHIGRLVPVKNHSFLLEVFSKVHEKNKNAHLLLLGSGELEQKIRDKCHQLGLEQAVTLAGFHRNTEDYYCAMDVFCLPSLYEGLPVTLVEAQTSGLPCILSDVITSEADMGAGLFHPVSLDSPPEVWADLLLQYGTRLPQLDAAAFTIRAGFSVRDTARQLQEFYMRLIDRFVR